MSKKKADFQEGFGATITNAKSLFEVAKSAANIKQYGIGLSLCILASEEALKSIFLLVRLRMPYFEFDDFEKIYSDHKFKHEHIKSFFPLIQIFYQQSMEMKQELNKLLEEGKSNTTPNQKGTENIEDITQLLNEINLAIGDGISVDDAKDAMKWWENANLQKNSGLYVACNNDKWLSPQQVTKSKFSKGEKYTNFLIREAEYFAHILDDTKNQQLLDAIKPQLENLIN